jgi:iron complex outermembrane recepter protein
MKYRSSLRHAAVCLLSAIACAGWAQGTATAVDIPDGDLIGSLDALAKQAGVELIFKTDQLRGLRTQGARGALTAEAALQQLLRGHPLQIKRDPSGAFVIFRALPQPGPRAPSEPASGPGGAGRTDAGNQATPEKVVVTGSRIPRAAEELAISPVVVFSRKDIERSGVSTTGEFVARLPQNNSSVASAQVTDQPGSGRATVDLRSLGNSTTLVLLNGRRISRNGRAFGVDDYDLNLVPLSTIERIEVMSAAASAIYGADAIGGVVNIITRQEFTGAEVSIQHGNTSRLDVSETTASVLVGTQQKTATGLPFGITLNGSVRQQSPLQAMDRPYTATRDFSASGGSRPQPVENGGLAGGPGVVFALGPPFATLPGLGVRTAAIPARQSGRELQISDFDADAPLPTYDDGPRYTYLLPPLRQASVALSGQLGLPRQDELYFDGSLLRRETHSVGTPPATLGPVVIPASNPFNPFGVDVGLNKIFYQLGPSRTDIVTTAGRLTVGLRGPLPLLKDWSYDASTTYERSKEDTLRPVPGNLNCAPQSSSLGGPVFEPPCYKLLQETDPAKALNLLGDGPSMSAEDTAKIRALLGQDGSSELDSHVAAVFGANGTLGQMPGGSIRIATGAELRGEEVRLEQFTESGRYYDSLIHEVPPDGRRVSAIKQQKAAAVYAEALLPIVAPVQGMPWVHSLELSVAGRFDKVSAIADGQEVTPKAGLLWKPSPALGIRTTFSQGFKPPSLLQMHSLVYEAYEFFPHVIDPVTGNALDEVNVRRGGNPDLDSERSRSWTLGMVYEPPWLRGMSLSIDYFDTEYLDKVIPGLRADLALLHFPERVTRDPVSNEVTDLDLRSVNLNLTRSKSLDLRAVYRFGLGEYGSMTSRSNLTYNMSVKEQGPPGSPVYEYVDLFVPRVKAETSLFWSRQGYELGGTLAYESSVRNSEPTAPARIRRAIVVDLQGSVDFDVTLPGGIPVAGTGLKLTAGIQNLFDRKPSPTNGDGGWAKVDPRQSRFYLALRKSF